MGSAKESARELLEALPDDVTWDKLIYDMVVRKEIELGLADSDADNVVSVEELIKDFNIGE